MSYILDALKRSEQERNQGQIPDLTGSGGLFHVDQRRSQIWPYILIAVLLLNAIIYGFFQWQSGEYQDDLPSEHPSAPASQVTENKLSVDAAVEKSRPAIVVPVQRVMPKKMPLLQAETETPVAMELIQPASARLRTPEVNPVPDEESSVADEEAVYVDGGLLIQPKSERIRSPDVEAESLVQEPIGLDSSTPMEEVGAISEEQSDLYRDVPLLSELDPQFQRKIPAISFNSHIYSDTPSARRVMLNNNYLREGQGFEGLEVLEIGEVYLVLDQKGVRFKLPVLKDWQAR